MEKIKLPRNEREKKNLFLVTALVESAIVCDVFPVNTVGFHHKDFVIDSGRAGVLIAEKTLGVIPAFGIYQVLGLSVGDNNGSEVAISLLQTNIVIVEHLKHLGCNCLAHVAHLDSFCHTCTSWAFALLKCLDF